MKDHEEAVSRRRNFLMSALGAAMAFLAAKVARGQSAPVKRSTQGSHMHDEPHDAGLWITWYDLPADCREAYM